MEQEQPPNHSPQSSAKAKTKPRFGHDPGETRRVVVGRLVVRFWRAIDYLSIFVFTLVVYSAAVAADFLFFEFLSRLLTIDAKEYPLVALAFRVFRIGLALLAILLGCVHATHSAIKQIRLDHELSKEG
jgi:hypothetical protein